MVMATVEEAIEEFRVGRFVVVVDDVHRENEGDLMVAAELVEPHHVNFMARHGRGLICAALAESFFKVLKIPMMVPQERNSSAFQTNFGVSVGASKGVTTGISAFDRARTVRVLADPSSRPEDISMPGHIFPLRARENGVLQRRGHTEAAVDLARLSGLRPAGLICEIMNEDGTMARLPQLRSFGQTHGLKVISIADIVAYRHQNERLVQRAETARIPTEFGEFKAMAYRDHRGLEHIAMAFGELDSQDVLTRLHSECLTGDVFGSRRCDCGDQLRNAMKAIVERGVGLLIYLRQEGRGIGLANKIRAYALQEKGLDTVEANRSLGFPDDARTYDVGAAILRDLKIESVQLMTNNPKKVEELEACGIGVPQRVPLVVAVNENNYQYMRTKLTRLGHLLDEAVFEGQGPHSTVSSEDETW